MGQEIIEITVGNYERFIRASQAVAVPELEKLVQITISSLRDMDAVGMFGGVAARHLWDEYCWQLQEGPYDEDFLGVGSISANLEEMLYTVIEDALDQLPKHTRLFLSIHTRNDVDDGLDPNSIGIASRINIIAAVFERINQAASRRNLDFIGPNRDDVIPMEVSLSGLAGKALSDAGESSDFLSNYVDQLIEGGAENVTQISNALLDRYMQLLREDEDGFLLSALLDRFEDDIRALVLEKDVLPAAEDAIGQLEYALDGES